MKKSHNSILRFSSRLFSVLLVLMLVGVVFVPAVAADNVKLTAEEYPMELISSSGTSKDYMVYSDAEKTKPVYFVRSEQVVIDSKLVNTAKIYAVDENGRATSDVEFGFDSYWWHDEEGGLHIHIGPSDMGILKGAQGGALNIVIVFLTAGASLGVQIAAGILSPLASIIVDACYGPYVNPDGSLDVYVDQLTQTLIPIYIALPGVLPVMIRLGNTDVPYFF